MSLSAGLIDWCAMAGRSFFNFSVGKFDRLYCDLKCKNKTTGYVRSAMKASQQAPKRFRMWPEGAKSEMYIQSATCVVGVLDPLWSHVVDFRAIRKGQVPNLKWLRKT